MTVMTPPIEAMVVVDTPPRRGRPPGKVSRCQCGVTKKAESARCRPCYKLAARGPRGETALKLAELAAAQLDLNLTEAAEIVGVTRERVRQIANRDGLPIRRGILLMPRPACDVCGKPVTQSKAKVSRHKRCTFPRPRCVVCDEEIIQGDRHTGRVRKFQPRHRKCILPHPPSVCPVCKQSFNPDYGQRGSLRNGGHPTCGKQACKGRRP